MSYPIQVLYENGNHRDIDGTTRMTELEEDYEILKSSLPTTHPQYIASDNHTELQKVEKEYELKGLEVTSHLWVKAI